MIASIVFIYHLSYPRGCSGNTFISKEVTNLYYSNINNLIAIVLLASHQYVIIKKDIKDTFRNIPVAPRM